MNLFVRQSKPNNDTAPEAQSSLPTLILLHGLFGMSDNLRQLATKLEAHFSVHNIDLPGHGRSTDCEFEDIEGMSAWIEDYIKQHKLTNIHLVGHSLGAKVAMQVANNCAESISCLALADIAPVKYKPSHLEIFKGLSGLNLATLESRQEADSLLQSQIQPTAVRQFLLKNLYKNDQQQWAWRFNLSRLEACYPALCGAPQLSAGYQGAVMFIKGELSNYISDENKADILAHYPQAQIKTIAGAGHWLHVEKADAFYQVLLSFLQTERD